jgi:type II secretory pathway pseudopilin PulG
LKHGRAWRSRDRRERGRDGYPLQRRFSPAGGFSLVELMAAMMITVVAIMGLAHTFGLGTSFVDRYATARAALARASGQIEHVRAQVRSGAGLADADSSSAIQLAPGQAATLRTRIAGQDDPADGTGGASDYYRVTATVRWTQAGMTDSIDVATLVLRP